MNQTPCKYCPDCLPSGQGLRHDPAADYYCACNCHVLGASTLAIPMPLAQSLIDLACQIARRSPSIPDYSKPDWALHNAVPTLTAALTFIDAYTRSALHGEAGLDDCPECGGTK